MSYELAQKFEDFKIPEAFLQARKLGMGMGSLDFTKMMLFANEVQLNNDNIDYFMSLPPRRQEDETKEQLKVRSKFTSKLLKYRAYLYDFSIFPSKKEKRKQNKLLNKN